MLSIAFPAIVACRPAEPAPGKAPAEAVSQAPSIADSMAKSVNDSVPGEDFCVSGEPGPWFQKGDSGVVGSRFSLLSPHLSRESVLLVDGDSLVIENGSCEYWVDVLTFQTRKPVATCPQLASYLRGRLGFLSRRTVSGFFPDSSTLEAFDRRFEVLCDSLKEGSLEFSYGNPEMPTTFSIPDTALDAIRRSGHDTSKPTPVQFVHSIGPM